MANRRDIELLISARETTGRSFKQVTDNIAALNASIGQQITQAERGEASLQDLRRTQESLAQAGRDLSAIQGQIDTYNKLAGATDALAAKADKAQKDLETFRGKIAEAGETTAAQENKLARLENAVVKTGAALQKNTTDLAEQVAALGRAGIATEQLETAQASVVNTARQIGAGLAQVNGAIDAYSTNVAAAQAREASARREATDLAKLETREKKLALSQQVVDQQEAVARQTALIENLREAEQRLAQQNAFDKKIADAQRLGDASRFVQLFADSVQTVAAAENQLSALSGFRAVGQAAVEASNDMSRFVEAGQSMAITSSQVAAGLRAIVDPGSQALRTLDGIEAAIQSAADSTAGEVKNISLLSNAYNDLSAAAAALLRQGSLVDTFRDQEAATKAAQQQFAEAQAEVQRLGAAMAAANAPTEEMARSLQLAEQKLTATGRALSAEETKLGTLSRELKAAKINTADLAAEQQRLQNAATQASGTLDEINKVLGRGGQKTDGLFGLKPNDLANLTFQLNDIVVSLASGQNPFIVLIQQGSQIGQLFPGVIATIGRFALAFAPVIAAVGLLGFAFASAVENANRFEEAQLRLLTTIGGANYNPEQLVALGESLEAVGAKYEEVADAAQVFVKEGLPIEQVQQYTKAAYDLSQVLGVDLAEAAGIVNSINTGGIEQLDELQTKTGDLTQAEYDHAKALFEAGRAAEARQHILDIVARRNAEIAERTRSIWTPAVNNLRQAFSNLGDFLASVLFGRLTTLRRELDNIAIGAAYLFGLLAGKGFDGAKADARTVFDNLASQQAKRGAVAGGSNPQQVRDTQFAAQLDEEVKSTRQLTNAERLREAGINARVKAQQAGVSVALEERAVQQAIAIEQRKIDKEGASAAKRSSTARSKAAREAETAANKIRSLQKQLDGQIRSLDQEASRGPSATLEARLDAIDDKYAKIGETIQGLKDKGIANAADGTSLKDITARVDATKARLKDEERIKFFQEQAALLEKQRAAEIERITDAQTRGAISAKEAVEQAAEANGRLSPQIVKAAQSALAIARSIAGTNPSPEMVSWIASLERIINGEGTNRIVADVGVAGLDETSGKLDQLIKERDDLVRSYQTLNELGLQTDAETRDLTAQAYQRQGAAIQPVLVQLREQVELLHNTRDALTGLPILSDTAYATWQAKLDAVNAGLQVTDARMAQINVAAMNGIQNGVSNAFKTVGASIAGLIVGTQSWGDALNSVLNAGLSLVGSFLQAIADVLVQMLAVQAAKALIGGSTGGFGSLFFHDGGVVGKGGSRKKVSGGAGSWIGAPKFHGGGGLGLKPDEYKAVLQRGEEVLTEDNPRHINNVGSGGPAAPTNLKQVLYLDPAEIAGAMQGRAGEKTFMSFISANKQTIKQVLS